MQRSKIYVAGGTGLVGSAIIKKLQERGYTDIVSTYHERKPTIEGVRWIQLDLLDQQATEDFFAKERPDYVYLAAAKVGGIVANNIYRADFIYHNLQIQNNIIHSAYKHNVKKLLFLGSTCIYPKNCPQPIKEEYLLTGELEYTNEPYAIAKIAGIKMCESFNLQYGTNYISVMPTNLYGPNDNFDLKTSHVLPALLRKMYLGKCLQENSFDAIRKDLDKNPIEGIDGKANKETIEKILAKYGITKERIEIWGSGKPRREFLYSEDMADACVYLMEKIDFKDILQEQFGLNTTCDVTAYTTKEVRNTHINIGTGEDISIKELALLIKDIVGYEGALYFNTSKPDGTMRKVTDVSKLHSLGWHNSVELEEGVKRIYEWYVK